MPAADTVYLGLDCATPHLALALWSPEGGVLGRFCEEVGRDHAQRILLELEALLGGARVDRGRLRGIGVGVGPGSYTGLRVAIATAKGLARALAVPLSGHSTLAAIAYARLEEGQEGIVALDARRGNVYAARFKRDGPLLVPLGPVVKTGREALRREHEGLLFVEDAAPDGVYLARQAFLEPASEVTALYL